MEITQEQRDAVLRLHDDGKTATAIALGTGVPAYLVREVVREAGRPMVAGRKSKAEQYIDQIASLVEDEGLSLFEVAERIKIPYQTVRRWAGAAGIETDSSAVRRATHLATVLEMYRADRPVEEITAETGVRPRTVARWVSQEDVHRKPPGGSKPLKRDRNIEQVLVQLLIGVHGRRPAHLPGSGIVECDALQGSFDGDLKRR